MVVVGGKVTMKEEELFQSIPSLLLFERSPKLYLLEKASLLEVLTVGDLEGTWTEPPSDNNTFTRNSREKKRKKEKKASVRPITFSQTLKCRNPRQEAGEESLNNSLSSSRVWENGVSASEEKKLFFFLFRVREVDRHWTGGGRTNPAT